MLAALVLSVLCLVGEARGHGYMIDPPARSSMWRVGFKTPINYNDMSLNCGGYQNEHFVEHGKCGVCGDPYSQPQPRDNEAGGKYGRGVIGRQYKENQDIHIGIKITANHEGYFEFRLCKNDDVTKVATQSCLDQHLLQIKNGTGSGNRYHLPAGKIGLVDLTVTLPSGVTCSQCVLQWKWRAGNNYGMDSSHHSCVGCGPQEEFYGCSDVAIGSSGVQSQTGSPTHRPPQTPAPVTRPLVQTSYPTHPPVVTQHPPNHQNYGPYKTCRGVHNWSGLEKLDQWCVENCFTGNCPSFLCYCPDAQPVTQKPLTPSPVTPRPSTPPITFPTYTPAPLTPKIVVPPLTKQPLTSNPTTRNPNFLLGPQRLTGFNEFDACRGTGLWGIGDIRLDNWCVENCFKGNCPSVQCKCPSFDGQNSPKAQTTPHVIPYMSTRQRGAILGGNGYIVEQTPTRVTGHGPFDACHGVGLWGLGLASLDNWCIKNCALGNCPSIQCYCPDSSSSRPESTTSHRTTTSRAPTAAPILKPLLTPGPNPDLTARPHLPPQVTPSHQLPSAVPSIYSRCHGVNNWQGVPQLDVWCQRSCAVNYCPPEMCLCPFE